MKRLLLFFISFLLLSGCDEYRNFYRDPDVHLFIKQVKAGTFGQTTEYPDFELPDFERRHIPALLQYIDDMTSVNTYPVSPVSSKFGTRWIAEGVLWTIDGIRLGRKYPCTEGVLSWQDDDTPTTMADIKIVAELYKAWWEGKLSPNKERNIFLDDPLANTNYYWK